MKIEVIGPFRGITGYDNHTRCFIREMRRQGVQVSATHIDGWSNPVLSDADLGDIIHHPDQSLAETDIALHFMMPVRGGLREGKKNLCYTMFEADGIVYDWLRTSLRYDVVIVPTVSSEAAWVNSGFPKERLRICPLGVDFYSFESARENFLNAGMNRSPISKCKHIFLNIADLRPRKNHLGLLRAWLRATDVSDDAVLVLKINPLEPMAKMHFEKDFLKLQNNLGKYTADAAPIVWISACLPEKEIQFLYGMATNYISMSHGEGWDLPMTEAMASGLHVIAPFHSAYESYLTEQNATLIPAEKSPAEFEGTYHEEDKVWFQGLHWWRPNEDCAVEVIRRLIAGTLPRIKTASEFVKNNLSWKKATARLIEILKELEH